MPATNRFELPIPERIHLGFEAYNEEADKTTFIVGSGPSLWYWITNEQALKYGLRAGQNVVAVGGDACYQFVRINLPRGELRRQWMEYFAWFSPEGWHELRMERYAELGTISEEEFRLQREQRRAAEKAEEDEWEKWVSWKPGEPRPDAKPQENLSTGNSNG